jgi:hypothetical protein
MENPMDTSDIHALKTIIQDSIREVLPDVLADILKEERLKLCKLLIPVVSDDEQANIDQELGTPDEFDETEFVNLTDWTEHGHPLQ